MQIIEMLFNENLIRAESNLNRANGENIIELCRDYLKLLTEYRKDLYSLRGSPEINLQQSSLLARELAEQVRKVIRTTLEITTLKSNQIEQLLNWFTNINGYEAVATFNEFKYRGYVNWELKSNSIIAQNGDGFDQVAIQEAVGTASLLRIEHYIKDKTTFTFQNNKVNTVSDFAGNIL